MGKEKSKIIRLERLLSNLGYGGRREMAMAIKNEWVSVDGNIIKNPAFQLNPNASQVKLDGEIIDPISPMTVMLHKPEGYTCSHNDSGDLVYDLMTARFKSRKPTFSSIGRLDKYSTGQLLFTDDGDLLHRIISPKSCAKKHYHVTLRDNLKGNETDLFSSGEFYMDKDDKPLKPATWIAENERNGTMILSEGRFHQIRRMFETIGNEVLELHRFQTGGLSLGDLPKGEWRILNDDDLKAIFDDL